MIPLKVLILFWSVMEVFYQTKCTGKSAKILADEVLDDGITDPIENANKGAKTNLFENDIILTNQDANIVDRSKEGDVDGDVSEGLLRRSVIVDTRKLWPFKIVPYEILPNAGPMLPFINQAFQEFAKHTCIVFRPRNEQDQHWIRIVSDPTQGCSSLVGRNFVAVGPQPVNLAVPMCQKAGIVMHELMHAIGFWHEQSRFDRGKYVRVNWENIPPNARENFNRRHFSQIDYLETPYDVHSVMHYRNNELSMNGKPTMQFIKNNLLQLGQREGFSQTDVARIKALYKCHAPQAQFKMVHWFSRWSAFGPCDTECNKFRQRYCLANNIVHCPGANQNGIQIQSMKCSHTECNTPVNGHWGRWTAWSTCSASCGTGTTSRIRFCDDPVPRFGGANCEGLGQQMVACTLRPCEDVANMNRDKLVKDKNRAHQKRHRTKEKKETKVVTTKRKDKN
uniref:Metalloendopeptidase n=1 Tax=Pachycerianthus maua TaxID=2736681 RepID=A0A7G7WYT4_9CNID|nr:toxin candidate TRINITY_DN36730_c0_g1_i5 [Pachycerianthus maua]